MIALVLAIMFGVVASVFFYSYAKLKTENSLTKNELETLRLDRQKLQQNFSEVQQKNFEFEKQNELLKVEAQRIKNEKEEWQKEKEVALFKLSEELMKRNAEQQNILSQNQQENIKKITENLFKNFENVTTKIVALNDEVKKSSDENLLLKNALLSPSASGRAAEITLENILKNSGLKEKYDLNSVGDYVLQSHFSGLSSVGEHESKRPDVILFLPDNRIAVIDSKSSPHFVDLENAKKSQDFEAEKLILAKIKESFRRHLESLKRKDYTKFLFEELLTSNRADYKIITVMFLQTEKMLEIISENDEGFLQRALEANILVLTPVGLINFLSQARFIIDRVRQEKNIEDLKIQVSKMLDSVALVFKESKEVGKSLNKALSAHNKMAKNLNNSVYKSIKNIAELGIEGKKSAEIKLLEDYDSADENEGENV